MKFLHQKFVVVEVEEGVANPPENGARLEANAQFAAHFVDGIGGGEWLVQQDDQVELLEERLGLGVHWLGVNPNFHHFMF